MAVMNSWMPTGTVGWQPGVLAGGGGLHTRLLGFVKTALLRQLVTPGALVCDLFCGRGLDTARWAEAEIGRYIGVDLSASALVEAKLQWEQHDRPFAADFYELDPCIVELEDHLDVYGLPADVVCCLAHLQDSFTSEDMVRHLLKNVATVLKPGGFFFGTAPDSSTIWYKYQKAVEGAMKNGSLRVNGTLPCVRSELYRISFDDDRFHAFGSKYHLRFTDDGLPPQAQILVHFPSLIRLAKEVGLECVEIQNLHEFYDDSVGSFADVLRSSCASLVDSKGVPVLDARGRLNAQAVDVLSLYTTFIFKKGNTATNYFRSSPRSGDEALTPTAQYLAQFPRPVQQRRQEHHQQISLKSEMPSTSSSRRSEQLQADENDYRGADHGEDYVEVATDDVTATTDVGGGTRTPPEAASVEQDAQDAIDYSHKFSEDRLSGLKKGFKEKYYTRSARPDVHQAIEIEDDHPASKSILEAELSISPSTSGGAQLSVAVVEVP